MVSNRFFVLSSTLFVGLLASCSGTDTLPLASESFQGAAAGSPAAGSSSGGSAGSVAAGAGGEKGGTSPGGSAGSGGSLAGTGGASGQGGTTTTGGAAGASGKGGAGQGGSGGQSGAAGMAGSATGGSSGSGGGGTTKHWCDLPLVGDDPGVVVPDGFCVRNYVTMDQAHVNEPRTIRFAPNGDVFVAAPSYGTPGGSSGGLGAIFVLPDDNHDGVADAAMVYAGGTNNSGSCFTGDMVPDDYSCVHGIAFIDGYLYWTKRNELRRIPYTTGDRMAQSAAGELVATLGIPSDGGDYRFTHTIDKAADGKIYVSRGRFDASCPSDATAAQASMAEGAVLAIDPTSTLPASTSVVADGFRNPMYLRCIGGGNCFADELSGDGWDSFGGTEKLALLQPVGHYGYPCCVDANKPVPTNNSVDCSQVGMGVTEFPLHSTPFGLDFEPGKWASPYASSTFIAFHGYVGSWLETRVAYVPMNPQTGLPTGDPPVDFATGYGQLQQGGNGGRAADLAFAPDGRLFVIDDQSGIIVWIAPVDLAMP